MIFPEPVISIAIEPKTKADVEKLGVGLQKLAAEDPSFRMHTDEEIGPDDHQRDGRAPPRDHRRPPEARVQGRVERRQARGRVPRGHHARRSSCEYKYAKQSGGRGQYGHVVMEIEPRRARQGLRVRERHRRRRHPEGVHPGDREGRARGDGARRPRRLPARRHALPPDRRQLPRGRLERAGVRGRGVALLPGRRQARRAARSSSRS